MTASTGSKQLMRVLATPSKVANALDWRRFTGGAIATLDVHSDRIGVRISEHPTPATHLNSASQQQHSKKRRAPTVSRSVSLPLATKGPSKIPESTRRQLSDLVHHHKVCGFVVSWPLQTDTGAMGAACGRTLFCLEELLRGDETPHLARDATRPVFAPSRPICLWDGSLEENQELRSDSSLKEDAFGRSPIYARTSDKTEHVASKEQYSQNESRTASTVWDDFAKAHWPEEETEQVLSSSLSRDSPSDEHDAAWESENASSSHPQQWQATIAA